jgi:hypothetical protein
MASSEVAAHAHFAILSCDVMGTDSESMFPLTSLCHWHIYKERADLLYVSCRRRHWDSDDPVRVQSF